MRRAVGIDLGTTFSAVAIVDSSGQPEVLKNAEGEFFTPSVIYLGGNQPIVGHEAKMLQQAGEEEVASFFKRAMGDRNWAFYVDERTYTPTSLSTLVLKKLKADAEATLGANITDAVITVPAYFSDRQRRNTIQAGEDAGLNVLRIINEPTAAAIAYGMTHTFPDGAQLLVYDLGGGTFDVTLVQLTEDAIRVLAAGGNHELGGKDWDDTLLRYVAQQFNTEHGVDPLDDLEGFNDLLVRAEQAKKRLSTATQTGFALTCAGMRGRYTITRTIFEELTAPLMEMTLAKTREVLQDADLHWADIDHILCVGGSSRMPMVHRMLQERTGKAPLRDVDVDAAVAYGAALQAYLDTAHTASTAVSTGDRLFLGGHKTVRDVMSHSLGMVAINEDRSRYINTILIPKNHPIPSDQTRPYQLRTRAHGSNEMEVYITQGESDRPLSCDILGAYRFTNIPHHRGSATTVLDICYAYDRNGVVQVSASDRKTGQAIPNVVAPVPEDISWMDAPPVEAEVVVDHLSLYIAFDLSGSMAGKPLEEAQRAAKGLVQQMDLAHTSIGLIAVADSVQIVQPLCQNARKLNRAIQSLSIGDVGYGNFAHPFKQAREALAERDGLRFVLVLADGVWSNQERAIRAAERCHEAAIDIIAIGFGGADEAFLQAIASSDEAALFTDLSQLSQSFDRVAQVLTESVGAQSPTSQSPTRRTGLLGLFN